ncbi:uncharacterized protein CLAFUR5_04608 [Fulvia fulva]|uniref:Myb-like domain-containing protein n=1 Tax=Passalora fulva TaxID=5499 RepID=A0A9Q8LFM7_PASFU|nr:uncharacterized protein CLAFUR5_04608 [Fulvia fulva]KAK4627913.1 hypothetical protein CLAFUR0_04637 [Fulvia fulva]UJO16533.1 hypothetical protein CLAFUR5_04608 [Fulvia fulva]WPV29015.1 hypothetical protein CLAFUW7_04641 [Fulvia fulva]
MAAPEENSENHIAFKEDGHPAKLRFTSFGSAADSLAAERELAEEARIEELREAGLPLPRTTTSKSKKKPARKSAKPAPSAEDAGEGSSTPKKGQGNHNHDIPPVWTDAENLALLKLVRDDPEMTFVKVADRLNEIFWKDDKEFKGRTINGVRPQYIKLMGANRTATIAAVPAKIKEIEEKMGGGE